MDEGFEGADADGGRNTQAGAPRPPLAMIPAEQADSLSNILSSKARTTKDTAARGNTNRLCCAQ